MLWIILISIAVLIFYFFIGACVTVGSLLYLGPKPRTSDWLFLKDGEIDTADVNVCLALWPVILFIYLCVGIAKVAVQPARLIETLYSALRSAPPRTLKTKTDAEIEAILRNNAERTATARHVGDASTPGAAAARRLVGRTGTLADGFRGNNER